MAWGTSAGSAVLRKEGRKLSEIVKQGSHFGLVAAAAKRDWGEAQHACCFPKQPMGNALFALHPVPSPHPTSTPCPGSGAGKLLPSSPSS